MTSLRQQAIAIWQAAVDAVLPEPLLHAALREQDIYRDLAAARRILVLGGGKAGSAMARGVEQALPEFLDKIDGWLNVPAGSELPTQKILLHAARPQGSNHPTEEGVAGTLEILRRAQEAGPDDVALCLMSGGGSALLPAPAPGVSLEDKQTVTKLLHACGATINEMNTVRKHLSAFKGGRLAQAFRGKTLYSLIISDVIGDPLDVIASGPTVPDPTTFDDARAILARFHLEDQLPEAVKNYLSKGSQGIIPDTPKTIPANIHNRVIGNNVLALDAAHRKAGELGFPVLNLGSYLEGETRQLAIALAGLCRSIREQGIPVRSPVCVLSGGETTVTLSKNPGKGGRNQEFVLAFLAKMQALGMKDMVVLSGGTDGEDGPTDAAGAYADEEVLKAAKGLDLEGHLTRNDSYPFFEAAGGLLKSGLTQTNVMDVRVILLR